jgi:hypothetical protein
VNPVCCADSRKNQVSIDQVCMWDWNLSVHNEVVWMQNVTGAGFFFVGAVDTNMCCDSTEHPSSVGVTTPTSYLQGYNHERLSFPSEEI